MPKERPNATRLLQHPFLAGVGHKAAPPHGALTLNTTIPPRVSPWEASSLAICGRPVLMLMTADHALGDTTPKSQGKHVEYNGFNMLHADVGRLAVTHTGRAESNGHSPHKPPDSPSPALPWEEPGGKGSTPPGTSPTPQ